MENNFKRYRFEDLDVWQIGMKIISEIYKITKKFPHEELYSATDQLKRAGNSIVLHIAEGSGQPTRKGFCVYLHRSKSSVLECVAILKIAVQEGFVTKNETDAINALLQEEYFKDLLHNNLSAATP